MAEQTEEKRKEEVKGELITLQTEKFFDQGFGAYMDHENFYDVTIHHVPSGKEYKGHRLILSYKSLFFELLFCSRFLESKAERVSVNFQDPDNVFPNVLEYFYKGETKIIPEQVVSMRVAADQFMCAELSEAVLNYLEKNLNHRNVFSIMGKALEANDDLVLEKTVDYIASEFISLFDEFKKYVDNLPPYVFFAVIGNENLTKKNPSQERYKMVSGLVNEFVNKHNIKQDIESLKLTIDSLISSNCLSLDDALMFLVECEKNGIKEQASGCARVIASNFFRLMGTDNEFIYKLNSHSFSEMISSDVLVVKSEDQIFDIASEYLTRKPNLPEEEKQTIMNAVRYTYLSFDKLKAIRASKNKYISKKTLLDALFIRAARIEGFEDVRDLKKLAPQHRPRSSSVFTYISDFDTNGILYWLGTNAGSEPYKNPVDLHLLDVTTSSNFEAGNKQNLVGRDPASCNLVNQANSSVTIQFKTITVLPTKYTLRHTNSRDNECLRNWKFQASKDGKAWTDLKDHNNDSSLNGKGSTASWDIDGEKIGEYFSHFKITQTGNNSAGNTYFSMSGFEIYGLVSKV